VNDLPSPVRVGLTLKRAQHLLSMRIDEALRPLRLNLGLWAVLREMDHLPPGASASELARASFHTPQTLGGLLQRLHALGLIERRTGRGRIVENRLTDSGQQALLTATAAAESVVASALEGFTHDERLILEQLANRLISALIPAAGSRPHTEPDSSALNNTANTHGLLPARAPSD
jgi:DNA-binding MarR family transcriptional regulator